MRRRALKEQSGRQERVGQCLSRRRKNTGSRQRKNLRKTECSASFMKQAGVRIRDNQIANVVALLKDADSVELKLTVPESDHQSSISALGIDVLDAELRQVVFFDTRDLKLNRHG